VTVDADGAVTAPGSPGGLDRPPGPRTETIQLLTPEGERVEHPDYPLELTTDNVKDLYRDLVLVRRIDTEAIAL
jgi:2-oxoisovalerate dehydrogenase E1 component subunit alpha